MPGVQESSARIAGLVYAEREAVWVTVVRNVGYEDERRSDLFESALQSYLSVPGSASFITVSLTHSQLQLPSLSDLLCLPPQ